MTTPESNPQGQQERESTDVPSTDGSKPGASKKNLLLSILPIVLIGGSISFLFWRVGPSNIVEGMQELPPMYIGFGFLFLALDLSADSMRYWSAGRALGSPISFFLGLRVCLVNLFGAFITPGAGGAAPAVAWYLKGRGFDETRGLSIAIIKGVLGFYVLVPCAACLALIAPGDVLNDPQIRLILLSSCLGVSVLLALITCIAIWPNFIANLIHRSMDSMASVIKGGKPTGKRQRFRRFLTWLGDILQKTAKDLGGFFRGKKRFVFATFGFTVVNIAVLMTIAFILGLGFGLEPGATKLDLMFMSILYVVLVFIAPTPGGAGIAEFGGQFMFDPVLGEGEAVAFTLIWRTFTCYIPFIMGAIVFSREVARTGSRPKSQA